MATPTSPTALIVHDAFTDASSFFDVTRALKQRGIAARVPANPLRSLAGDADAIARYATTFSGPILLVGHGYGGAVAVSAAANIADVVGLVHIAGLALDVGESFASIRSAAGLGDTNLVRGRYQAPLAEPGEDVFILIPDFAETWGADLPAAVAQARSVSQRPIADAGFHESAATAPPSVPTWYLVAEQDRVLPPETQRRMAERAGATVTSLESSHAVPVAHPVAVADYLEEVLARL